MRHCFPHSLLPVLLATTSALLSACTDADDTATTPQLVVDGWIDSNGFPVVVLTQSIPLAGNSGKEVPLSDVMVRWGHVVLSDGEETYTLIGSPDKRYTPPYIYRSSDVRGVPGRTYTLTASYGDLTCTAQCTMPAPTPIDSITIAAVAGNDTLRQVSLTFTPTADARTYYQLEARIRGKHYRLLPTLLSAFTTEGRTPATIPVYVPKSINDKKGSSNANFAVGDTVDIRLCTVTEATWRFWSAYNNAVALGSSVFISAGGDLPGNVSGGYGLWDARGVDTRTVIIE